MNRGFNNRKAGVKILRQCGFKEGIMNDVVYIMMKVGNLNIPWLTIVNQHLQSIFNNHIFNRFEL